MSSLYAVVEGKSEQAFAQQVLAVHLGERGVYLEAALVGKPGHKGGNRWPVVRRDIVNFLKMDRPHRRIRVTTMFDYYRMPSDWPGRAHPRTLPLANRAAAVEQAITEDVRQAFGDGFDASIFIPYVQMHELEALILAGPQRLVDEFPEREQDVQRLIAAIGAADPEEINDGATTAPSKRIIASIPEYAKRKSSAAPNILKLIGVNALRLRCGHFGEWIARLEQLGAVPA